MYLTDEQSAALLKRVQRASWGRAIDGHWTATISGAVVRLSAVGDIAIFHITTREGTQGQLTVAHALPFKEFFANLEKEEASEQGEAMKRWIDAIDYR